MDFVEYPLLGNYHASELAFVFANQWPPVLHDFSARDKVVAAQFNGYWLNMAATGDPNTGGHSAGLLEYWPQYDTKADVNLLIEDPLSFEAGLDAAQCKVWDLVYETLQS